MDELTRYAQELRVIGQALEILDLSDFTVESEGAGYRVIGVPSAGKIPRNLWWFKQPANHGVPVDWSFPSNDIERLEREGQSRRAQMHGVTDTTQLSQALRVIGSYLTQKYCRLVRISRKGLSFEVDYESSLGRRCNERLTAADLYGLWVRFYLQRSVRMERQA